MNLPDFKKISINGVEMKELRIGDTLIWKGGHTNLMPLSTEADGNTIYNGGLGFKAGYRIRSGGAEAEHSRAAFCTGFIPFKSGDVFRMYSPYGFGTDSSIPSVNVSDANKNNIGQSAYNGTYGILNTDAGRFDKCSSVDENGIMTFVSPTNIQDADKIAFARVTLLLAGLQTNMTAAMAETIITVNEEIEL